MYKLPKFCFKKLIEIAVIKKLKNFQLNQDILNSSNYLSKNQFQRSDIREK